MNSGEYVTINHKDYRLNFILSNGSGSYGEVWSATDSAGGPVALKIINAEAMAAVDPTLHRYWRDHLEQEIAFLCRLDAEQSRHIITLIDHGQLDDQPVLVLEQMQCHLGQWLAKQRRMGNAPPTLSSILNWVKQILSGLDTVHQAGFVYRDLKFSNILVNHDGALLKLADFGSLRLENGHHTRSFIGTPATMAPEQMLPVRQNNNVCEYAVDYRADYYALGLLLFTLITGEPSTEAQRQLGQLLAQYGQEGAIRYHGKLGGLDDREQVLLQNAIRHWTDQEPGNPGQTQWATSLNQLIIQLLASHPDDRPGCSADIYHVLGMGLISATDLHTSVPAPEPELNPVAESKPILPSEKPVNLRPRRIRPRASGNNQGNQATLKKHPAVRQRSAGLLAALGMIGALAWAMIQPDSNTENAIHPRASLQTTVSKDFIPTGAPANPPDALPQSTHESLEPVINFSSLPATAEPNAEQSTPTVANDQPIDVSPRSEPTTETATAQKHRIAIPSSISTTVTQGSKVKTSSTTDKQAVPEKRLSAKTATAKRERAASKKRLSAKTATTKRERAASKKRLSAKTATAKRERAASKKRLSAKTATAKRERAASKKRLSAKTATTKQAAPEKSASTPSNTRKRSTRKATKTRTARAHTASPKTPRKKVPVRAKPKQPELPPIRLVSKPKPKVTPPPIKLVSRSKPAPPPIKLISRSQPKPKKQRAKRRSQPLKKRSQPNNTIARLRKDANRTAKNIRRKAKAVGEWIEHKSRSISHEIQQGLNNTNREINRWTDARQYNRRAHRPRRDNNSGFAQPPPR